MAKVNWIGIDKDISNDLSTKSKIKFIKEWRHGSLSFKWELLLYRQLEI